MNRFAELTAFIPKIKDDAFGEWFIDRENDGSPEHPMQMPFVNYSKVVGEFIETLYRYCNAHPEFDHTHYGDTLKSIGLEWDLKLMEEAEVSSMDAKGVIALLIGVARAERFCDGALLAFLKNGCILRWLERLAEIDNRIVPGKYRHFKGGEYEVLFVAKHSETEEDMVVYRALYGEGGIWVRPASMWSETVERDGKSYLRFTKIN